MNSSLSSALPRREHRIDPYQREPSLIDAPSHCTPHDRRSALGRSARRLSFALIHPAARQTSTAG